MTTESLKEATKRSQDASERINRVWKGQPDEEYRKAVQAWYKTNEEWVEVVNALNAQEEQS